MVSTLLIMEADLIASLELQLSTILSIALICIVKRARFGIQLEVDVFVPMLMATVFAMQ